MSENRIKWTFRAVAVVMLLGLIDFYARRGEWWLAGLWVLVAANEARRAWQSDRDDRARDALDRRPR